MTRIRYHGTIDELRDEINGLIDALTGKAGRNDPRVRGVLLAIGLAALSSIKEAFVIKARGGTDAMGISWPELKPETIARRRQGSHQKHSGKVDKGQYEAVKKQRELRQRIQRREFKRLFAEFSTRLPEGEARARANRVASQRATAQSGMTIVEALGGRVVEILRDTGALLNSLSPGEIAGDSYVIPEGQLFELAASSVILGSNLIYAATHNFGDAKRRIPRRQFLPDDDTQVPQEWLDDWVDAGRLAIIAVLQQELAA